MQGFMLDSARCLESRAYYRRFIRFIAERGADTLLWHFSDDQGCSLRFDSLPQAASPNAYTKSEMRELIQFAKDHGIQLIPELASLGHTRYITKVPEYADLSESNGKFSTICPVDPRTQQLMARLLDEVIQTFDSPLVHIGADEVSMGQHPLTQAALQSRTTGDLFAEHVNRLHRQLSAAGRRTMMWADQLIADPTIIQHLPRDILMCNWHYHPGVCPSSTRQLIDAGFEVVLCPALISHNQTVYPGESFAHPNLRSMATHRELGPQVVGWITTVWMSMRYLPETLWPAVHFATAVMKHGDQVDPMASLAEFARSFHGMEPSDQWLAAMRSMEQLAPHRNAWSPVSRLLDSLEAAPAELEEMADQFARIDDALRAARPQVKSNVESFDRILLLVDVLEHAWRRAAAWRAGTLSQDMLDESEQLLERLSQAWDEEHFSDDPRKDAYPQFYDNADHLLLAMREGTNVLREAIQPAGAAYASGVAGK